MAAPKANVAKITRMRPPMITNRPRGASMPPVVPEAAARDELDDRVVAAVGRRLRGRRVGEVDRPGRAEPGQQVELVGAVDRGHLGAGSSGELHRERARSPARAVHQHVVARTDARQPQPLQGEAARLRECGRVDEADPVRDAPEVRRGCGDELGEAAPAGARQVAVHPVADGELRDAVADGDDLARDVRAEHRQAGPEQPADAARSAAGRAAGPSPTSSGTRRAPARAPRPVAGSGVGSSTRCRRSGPPYRSYRTARMRRAYPSESAGIRGPGAGVSMHVDATEVEVAVIGAGQAGLSAAYHLQRRGFTPVTRDPDAAETFVVLDANAGTRRGVAAPVGIAAHGHRERHPRAARASGAAGRPGDAEPRRPAALLRRLRAALRPRRAAAGAGAGRAPRRRRPRRPPPRRDRPRHVGRPPRHQRHRHVDAPVPPLLPRDRSVPRSAAARRRLRLGRRVRRASG